MSDGKSESDISEVLRRKRVAEGGEPDEKAKRREDILKRIEERKKQRETDSPKVPDAQPNRTEIVILEQKVHSLETQIKEFQSQKEFDISQINNNHQKELSKLNATVDQLLKKLEELENAHKLKLSETAKAEENEVSQLQSKLTAKEQENNKLTTENATLQSKINEISTEKSNLEKTISENQGKESNTNSAISNLENENKSLKNEVAAQKETIKNLENEIENLKKSGENFETEKKNLQSKITKSEKEFEDSKEFFESQLAKLNAEIQEKTKKIESLGAENQQLSKNLSDAEKVAENARSAPVAAPEPAREPETKQEEAKQEEKAKEEAPAEIKTPAAEENKKAEHPEANRQELKAFANDLLNEINKLRANPKNFVEFIENFGKFDGLKLQTQSGHTFQTKEGYEAVMDAIKFLQSSPSAQPLKLVEGLSLSCQYLCDQNGPVGKTESDANDGTSSADRLNKYGKWRGRVMELTSFGPRSNVAKDVLYQWLVDDGNSARAQRKILLDEDFTVAGIGAGYHSKLNQMAVLAVARKYDSLEDLKKQEESGAPASSNLRETPDGNNYLIVSEPCRIPKANVKLLLKGAHLKAVLSAVDGEPSKTATLQWNLPFEVPPGNIKAIYNEATEIEITIKKAGSADDSSVITDFSIAPNEASATNRLKIQVDQQPNVIAFVLDPCNCKVDITIKVIDGNTLCFDSLYTEVTPNPDGGKVTKATNRKEKIQMPFAITAADVSWVQTDSKGYSISVKKPSGAKEEVEIPIQ